MVSFHCLNIVQHTAHKSYLHYTRGITLKRITSGGIHLRGLALGQHSSEETLQRCPAVGDTASDLTGPGIEPHTSRADSDALTRSSRHSTAKSEWEHIITTSRLPTQHPIKTLLSDGKTLFTSFPCVIVRTWLLAWQRALNSNQNFNKRNSIISLTNAMTALWQFRTRSW